MRRLFLGAIFLFLLAGFAMDQAWADTDQRCLILCTNSGGKPETCLAQCAYNPSPAVKLPQPDAQPVPEKADAGKNGVFNAPAPMANGTLLPGAPAKKPSSSKDYTCIAQCLKNGSQYRFCEQTCTKQDCPPGKILCKDSGPAGKTAAPGTAIPGFKSP